MLIEFSVSNFRSFRDRQTFSMVAAPRLRKKENVISPVVKGEKVPDLLKVAAVYGPNASGKSNLVKALGVFHALASQDAEIENPIAPFRFDPALGDSPSCFEWHFISCELRYAFELAVTAERIVLERLTVFPAGKETLLYERQYSDGKEQYLFGAKLEGGDLLHQAWRDLTNSRTLFIKQAVKNSRDELMQLRAPFEWLSTGGVLHISELPKRVKESLELCQVRPELTKVLADFLQAIDAPIASIRIAPPTPERTDTHLFSLFMEPDRPPEARFTHSTALGTADFDLDEESEGTKNLIGFWLPWAVFNARKNPENGLLVVDELDSSLHPNIVATLIKQRLQQTHSRQLIFTTHDTHLMDAKLLRRDQFWLTERDANGATQLYSIHDFEGRESEDIEKRYYEGRYRGLPILRRR